jgi:hypothetical protein
MGDAPLMAERSTSTRSNPNAARSDCRNRAIVHEFPVVEARAPFERRDVNTTGIQIGDKRAAVVPER